jgi:hypothetical protein
LHRKAAGVSANIGSMRTPSWKLRFSRVTLSMLALISRAAPLHAQMPFYTDDPSVTPTKTVHIEVFDEYDGLHSSQFPDERQNTTNVKVNMSPSRSGASRQR